jgi:hypothetical protein
MNFLPFSFIVMFYIYEKDNFLNIPCFKDPMNQSQVALIYTNVYDKEYLTNI